MKKCLFTGVATALATPFDDNGINIKELSEKSGRGWPLW